MELRGELLCVRSLGLAEVGDFFGVNRQLPYLGFEENFAMILLVGGYNLGTIHLFLRERNLKCRALGPAEGGCAWRLRFIDAYTCQSHIVPVFDYLVVFSYQSHSLSVPTF